jgi:hypothetical protein
MLTSPGGKALYCNRLLADLSGQSHPPPGPGGGCDVPGYLCEVHHVDDYAACQTTNMGNLTFVCGSHHRLVKRRLEDPQTCQRRYRMDPTATP